MRVLFPSSTLPAVIKRSKSIFIQGLLFQDWAD
jgi:hypothetical protein